MLKIDILIETKAMCKQHVKELQAVLGEEESRPITMKLAGAIDEIDKALKPLVAKGAE